VIRCGARLESLRLEAMQETQWRAMSLYAKFLMRKEEEDAARS
jgi:hypothetical protein